VKDDKLFLIHISESIARIEQYLPSRQDEFMDSSLIQDAVIRNLQVMAESTQRLSDSLKEQHPQVPWRKIAGFRNVLVHDYLGIDLDRIWEIVHKDLPQLKASVEKILNQI